MCVCVSAARLCSCLFLTAAGLVKQSPEHMSTRWVPGSVLDGVSTGGLVCLDCSMAGGKAEDCNLDLCFPNSSQS